MKKESLCIMPCFNDIVGYRALALSQALSENFFPMRGTIKLICFQELRQMEHIENPTSARRNTIFCLETASDQSHLKTELVLLQRKYERLAQKEHRMQASTFSALVERNWYFGSLFCNIILFKYVLW